MSEARIGSLMLIDDDPVDQLLHRRIVERSGLVDEILQFRDPEHALAHLHEGHQPDAILLDIRMPRMSGFEFLDAALDEIGERFSSVVVLMLTTSLDPRDQARAARYDVVKEYLFKPLAAEELPRLAVLVAEQRSA